MIPRFAHHLMTWSGWCHRHKLPFELDAALSEIKRAGYDGVELGGDTATLGTPGELRRRLDSAGLEIAAWASSVTANPWPPNTAAYRREMDYAAELDVTTIAVCGGFLGERRRTTFDSDYALFAESLAAASAYAAERGQSVAFHPHIGCIVETIAEVAHLRRHFPALKLCLDTGHLAAVRDDPLELMRRAGDGVIHFHLKDWDRETCTFAEPGSGNAGLDFAAILAALDASHYGGWLVVERDDPPMAPRESAEISRRFLSAPAPAEPTLK